MCSAPHFLGRATSLLSNSPGHHQTGFAVTSWVTVHQGMTSERAVFQILVIMGMNPEIGGKVFVVNH